MDHTCPSVETRPISIKGAHICPGFGHNIVHESRFTFKDFIITKKQKECKIVRGSITITALRGADQLFYLNVVPTTTSAVPPYPPNVSPDSAVLNARGLAVSPLSLASLHPDSDATALSTNASLNSDEAPTSPN